MPEVPQFDLPFRIVNGSPATNEQGSLADVATCITAICRTEPGTFLDLPDFGLPDPTFEQEPIDTASLLAPISRWEPRAQLVAEVSPAKYDAAVENANIEIRVPS